MLNFRKTLDEYYAYRQKCGLKKCSAESIEKFYSFSHRNHPDEPELTQRMIDEWWAKRPTENASSHCIRVCQALPYLRYIIGRYPSAQIVIPKVPKWSKSSYIPHAFTQVELQKFFNACDNMSSNNTLEMRLNRIEFPVLFRALFSTGMRTTEIRLLSTKNVNLEKGIISICRNETKGYIERKVYLHKSLQTLLIEYEQAVSKMLPNRKIFFPNDHDEVHSDEWISYHFRRLWLQAGNEDGVIAYDLRHNFIIENINSWINTGYEVHAKMVALSQYVGHADIGSTYSYYAYVPRLGNLIESVSKQDYDNMVPLIPSSNETN
jgi:integrase